MKPWPRISIVTPSFNQGHYIAATIDSVLAQQYPNCEHIIIDGGSTDETLDVLRRYPHLKIISEPDRGHADALNKGFRLATGDIWGYLNSDDTLLPQALHRVAQEVDPQRARHIVMGRCRFIDEQGRVLGIEHPSHFVSHRRVLAIWKGHTIPQPAVFWTPEVWHRCGGMDESVQSSWIDYDLFCRFSRQYDFHMIDQVLATYRLHSTSKTAQQNDTDRLTDCLQISKRYWDSPLSLQYWHLTLSLAWYRFNRTGRARAWLRQAQDDWCHHHRVRALPYGLAGGVLAPEVTFYVTLYPFLRERAKGVAKQALQRLAIMRGEYPQTAVYLDHVALWNDGWAGPRLVLACDAVGGEQTLVLQGWVDLTYISQPLVLTASMDRQQLGVLQIGQSGPVTWHIPLEKPVSPGQHIVEVQASAWYVPHRFTRGRDFRPLAWRVESIRLCPAV